MRIPAHEAPSWSALSLVRDSSPLPDPMPDWEITDCINRTLNEFEGKASKMLGYQANQAINCATLAPFLNYHPNNVGDPYIDSNYGIHSRHMERAVIEFFAHLYHSYERNYWGYITSGGTEANIYGIYVGRNYLESTRTASRVAYSPQPHAYFSEDTHYSINKAMDILRIPSHTIPSDRQGRIQVQPLMEAILRIDPSLHPPLIIANIGTTFTGAYDDVEGIAQELKRSHIKTYYIHVDAALGGLFLPFVERIDGVKGRVPIFDFRLPVGGIAVSGHKAMGAPFPCGVYMTLQENLAYGNARQVEYIGSVDSTLAGSRSGLAAIAMWYAIARAGVQGFVQNTRHMIEMADYSFDAINAAGFKAWKADLGLSVVFDRPPEWVVRKWSLSTQHEYCHIFAMAHVTKEHIDLLVEDLKMVRDVFALAAAEPTKKVLDHAVFLKSVELFSFMKPDDLSTVAKATTERRIEAGTYLCHQEDQGDEMYIVVQGEVEIVDETDPRRRVKYVAKAGEVIGEIAVLTSLTRTAAMRCRTDTHLLELKGDVFRTVMHQHPEIAGRIIQMLAHKLAGQQYYRRTSLS